MSSARNHLALPTGYRLHWYELDSVLGQGGFGITYLAHDTNLGQPAAIKEFLPANLAGRTRSNAVHPLTEGDLDTYRWGLDHFLNEARTLAKFRHPAIVRVVSVFEANDTAYMVMEYERGASFEAALKMSGVRAETRLKEILLPLLDGLELVHEAGFIHRDIKPSNIYLRDSGEPVLLDFGSARLAMGAETRTLATLVSPGFAPFEQYNTRRESDKQGPWTDIYALGATMYRAVTGKSPVDAAARANLLLDGENDPFEPCSRMPRNAYSPSFLHALDRALEFRAADRPQSVAEWRELLLTEHLVVVPRTVSRNEEEETAVRAMDLMLEADEYPDTVDVKTVAAIPERRAPPPGPTSRDRWVLPGAVASVILVVMLGWLYSHVQRESAVAGQAAPDAPARSPRAPVTAVDPMPAQATIDEAQAPPRSVETPSSVSDTGEQTASLPGAGTGDDPEPSPRDALSPETGAIVRTMLDEAADDLAALRLTTPDGKNAFEHYLEVLAVDPGNQAARAGLLAVAARYLELARGAADKGNVNRVESYLERAESVLEETQRLGGAETGVAGQLAAHDALRQRMAAALSAADDTTESAVPGLRYRVAIFPFAKASLNFLAADRELIEFANDFVRETDAYELTYSYYGDRSGAGELGPSLENMWAWKPGSTLRTPKIDEVFRLGKALDVDAVLTYAYQDSVDGNVSSSRFNVDGFLFDIGLRQIHKLSGSQSTYQQNTRKAFATFERRRSEYRRLASRVGVPIMYRFAMLPPHEIPGCESCDAADELRARVQPLLEGNPSVRLSPAYFDAVRPAALDDSPEQWWSGVKGLRQPATATIRPFAIDNEVDAVLIFSYSAVSTSRWDLKFGTVRAFIYDVAEDRLFERTGTRRQLADITQGVLSDFLGAHNR